MNLRSERISNWVLGCLALLVAGCGDDGNTDDDAGETSSSTQGDVSASATMTTTLDTTESTGETSTGSEDGVESSSTASDDEASSSAGDESSTGEQGELHLQLVGRHETGVFDASAAEIPAYDPATSRLFVVSAAAGLVDVLDLSDPTAPTPLPSIAMAGGGSPNSVDVHDGVVAVAVQNADVQAPGQVQFFTTDGTPLAAVTVGALPDMLTFTPDGTRVVVANEGEPDPSYTVDPEGTVSIVDLSGGVELVGDDDVITAGFGGFAPGDLDPNVRVFGPGASVAQDLEPEYIAVAADGETAWVTLQENNALAIVDLAAGTVDGIVGLGSKDHGVDGFGLDPSDEDGAVAIATWPVRGLYLPDAIAAFPAGGETFLVTANEGDARDYDAFGEEARVEDLILDPTVFPDAAAVQDPAALGRLRVTDTLGDVDDDGDHDALYAFGGRSIAIWAVDGSLVWDSGDLLEQTVAAALPDDFNSNNTENGSFDGRSDDKGPEPEGVVVADVFGSTYAFVGLERVGGIAVFELTDPRAPTLVTYVNDREFAGDAELGTAGDLGPEGLVVIPERDSPTGTPLLVVAHEVSGSVAVYEITLR